jgi:hypothetical protein
VYVFYVITVTTTTTTTPITAPILAANGSLSLNGDPLGGFGTLSGFGGTPTGSGTTSNPRSGTTSDPKPASKSRSKKSRSKSRTKSAAKTGKSRAKSPKTGKSRAAQRKVICVGSASKPQASKLTNERARVAVPVRLTFACRGL